MAETDIEMTENDLGCFIEPESLEMALEFSKRYTRLLKKEDHRSEIEGFKEYIQKNNELLNLIKELDSKES